MACAAPELACADLIALDHSFIAQVTSVKSSVLRYMAYPHDNRTSETGWHPDLEISGADELKEQA